MQYKKQPTSTQPEFQGAYWERIKKRIAEGDKAYKGARYD